MKKALLWFRGSGAASSLLRVENTVLEHDDLIVSTYVQLRE